MLSYNHFQQKAQQLTRNIALGWKPRVVTDTLPCDWLAKQLHLEPLEMQQVRTSSPAAAAPAAGLPQGADVEQVRHQGFQAFPTGTIQACRCICCSAPFMVRAAMPKNSRQASCCREDIGQYCRPRCSNTGYQRRIYKRSTLPQSYDAEQVGWREEPMSLRRTAA